MSEHRFSFSAETYDRHARPQRALARAVLARLPASPPDRVLELGAGTGLLTRRLVRRYPEARIDALDSAPGMIDYARTAFRSTPRVFWTLCDLQQFRAARPYPLVVSSAALQWAPDLEGAFRTVHGNLLPGGYFVFGLMLRRTLHELRRVRREIAPGKMSRFRLPTRVGAETALIRAGLRIHRAESKEYVFSYADTRTFLHSIHGQGVTGGAAQNGYAPLTRGEMLRLMSLYQRRHERAGKVHATYETLIVTATKAEEA